MTNSTTNGNTKQPSISVKKKIENLHYKYLFSIAYLTPQQEHLLLEEEKQLFKHIFENQDKLFSLENDNELSDFTKYTNELMLNVKDKYLEVFKDKTLNIDTNDLTAIDNSIYFYFRQLQNVLKEQIESHEIMSYIKCVLICSSLLFLIRTTKRALFIFISEQPDKKSFDIFTNLGYVIEYIKLFIISVDTSVKKQNSLFKNLLQGKDELTKQVEKLANQYNNCVDKINNLQEEKEKLEQSLNNANKYNQHHQTLQQELEIKQKHLDELQLLKINLESKINELEEVQKTIIMKYEYTLQKTAEDYEVLRQKLVECQDETNKLKNDPEFKQQLVMNAIEDTKNYKYLFSGMFNLSTKFKEMINRWEVNNLNGDLIYRKVKNNIIGLDESTSKLIKDGLNILTELYGDLTVSYPNTMNIIHNGLALNKEDVNLKNKFVNIVKLFEILDTLNDKPLLEKHDDMKIFYNSGELYKKMLFLYEDLSGAVRAIVRVRDVYQSITIGGSTLKRKRQKSSFTVSKKRKVYISGGGTDDKRFDSYEIKLDKSNKFVSFSGIDQDDKVFASKSLQHGPFFSVHNNEFNNPSSASVEDDLLNGIGFDSLTNIFQGTPEEDKEPAILIYTYGYSGSGKSYTLFGDKTRSTELPKKGVMWEMVRRLQKSYDMKLVNTTICYGYLDYESDGYVFKTHEPKPREKNSSNTNEWANIINGEFDDAMKNLNDDSFIKVTPNNPESSRGFYIIKVALYEKNSGYKAIKGYIGVVDMAGNEDPFDIATSICPTIKFDRMDILMKEPAQSYIYDVVYEEIKNVLIDILKPTILKVFTAKLKGYVTDLAKKESVSMVLDNKLDETTQERLVTLRDKLNDTFTVFKKPVQTPTYNTKNQKYITITTSSPYIFKFVNDSTTVSETLMEVPKVGDVKFNLSAELLQEICIYIKSKYNIISDNEIVTINDIREAILLGEQEKASSLKLKYAITQLLNQMKAKKGTNIVTMYIDVGGLNEKVSKDKFNGAKTLIQTSIIKSMESFNNQPYILPFTMNNQVVQYKYNTIGRIIKEGYYINKANAELMDYFKKKIHMHDINKIVTVKKSYNFDKSFSFKNYNKFKKDFVPTTVTNTNRSQSDFEYDTGLVDIIKKQFPGKNKDIIFACVRNDRDFGKILGAIDTLELIRDLKST